MITTKLVKADDSIIPEAADLLARGGIAAVPTETVYGLAANAYNVSAVRSVFKAKGRPQDNPLILHICGTDMLRDIAGDIPPLALTLAGAFWPGPLTMIFPRRSHVPAETCGGLDTAAVRMPNCRFTLKLIEKCGFPVAAPSANTSGLPSPTRAAHVYDDLNGKIPLIIDGGECKFGVESTVAAFDSPDTVRILRPGAVTPEMLREYCHVIIDGGVLERLPDNVQARSPGMKYRHYSPKAEVFILKGSDTDVDGFLRSRAPGIIGFLGFGDETLPDRIIRFPYGRTSAEQAENLFSSLRLADEARCAEVFVRMPDTSGFGLAVYNRLLRAAAFRIIDAGGPYALQ